MALREETSPTAIGEALERAGVVKKRDETPQQAAERIWKETKHDPIKTMRMFDEWARERPERMLAVIGADYWKARLRVWLTGNSRDNNWRYWGNFRHKLDRLIKDQRNVEVREYRAVAMNRGAPPVSVTREYNRQRTILKRARERAGIKIVQAEVDVKTGAVNVLDKEYGPFAHIRINGLELAKVTTDEALRWCENRTRDASFVQALCQLIPDPRKPIGDQWTVEIIREAKRASGASA